jgi:hypothetical protein
MLISTGVAGVVLVGGASVAATAFADRLQQGFTVTEQVKPTPGQVPPAGPGDSAPTDLPTELPSYDPDVVSRQVSVDPLEAADYWTKERIEDAEPMPMPQVTGDGKIVEPSSN